MKMKSIWMRPFGLYLLPSVLVSILWLGGCGSPADPKAAPPIQEDEKEKLVAALPSGVTMESPIESNVMLGANSKTVGEALAAVHAHVKDGKIYDGGMGALIEFKTGKNDGKSKPKPKRGTKDKDSVTTIVVTGG